MTVVRYVEGNRSVEINCDMGEQRSCSSSEYAYGLLTLATASGGVRNYTAIRYNVSSSAIKQMAALGLGQSFSFEGEAQDTTYLMGEPHRSEQPFRMRYSVENEEKLQGGYPYRVLRTRLRSGEEVVWNLALKVALDGSLISSTVRNEPDDDSDDVEYFRVSRQQLTPLASDLLAYFMFDEAPESKTRALPAAALVCFAQLIASEYTQDYQPFGNAGSIEAHFQDDAFEQYLLDTLTQSRSEKELREIVTRSISACKG